MDVANVVRAVWGKRGKNGSGGKEGEVKRKPQKNGRYKTQAGHKETCRPIKRGDRSPQKKWLGRPKTTALDFLPKVG